MRARAAHSLRSAWQLAYAWLWALTLTTAGATALIGPLTHAARDLLELRLSSATNPSPSADHVLALAAHNIPVCRWPLLLPVLGAQDRAWSRTLADVGVTSNVAINAILVGLALGAYGTRLLPYLPQLPLESGALALGTAAWILARDITTRPQLGPVFPLALALAAAAALETLVVPHR